jgi:hypothetical protein
VISIDDLLAGSRFLWNVPAVLRNRVALAEARATVARRLERRDADFLGLLDRAVYQRPDSPYRRLLALAGCELGDVEKLVRQEGVEGALSALCLRGVYLTLDEFKGRRPVVRGSSTIAIDPRLLGTPGMATHIPAATSGSRGARSQVGIDLASIRDQGMDTALAHAAWGDTGWRTALWGVPGAWSIIRVLDLAAFGHRIRRWFSQIDPAHLELPARYRLSVHAVRLATFMAGIPVPRPEYASLDDPLPVVRWMSDVLRRGETPHLVAFASSAVRLCDAALAAGVDLHGAQFTMSGEPVTPARLAAVRRAGGRGLPRYGSTEGGCMGYGCLTPEAADDVHAASDLHAFIQAGPAGAAAELPPRALLFSSLRPTARVFLLNVSLGDEAVLVWRRCDCPLGQLGWNVHLHTVRSYEKLTAGGMMFHDSEIIRVLEEVLPARFGGGATDYQLREEEGPDGSSRLRLLVHPRVGSLDPDQVVLAFFQGIGPEKGAERVMSVAWREAGFLRVERRIPGATAAGKILHLHQTRPGGGATRSTP